MADLRSVSRDFLTELLELYKSLPALWKVKSKDYSDRNKKNAAYEKMINKMKEVDPEATKDTIKKKINSLRSSYRKELKKVNNSERSGASADDKYEPSLWYFHLLDFLKDQETPREPVGNFDDLLCQDESSTTNSSPPPPRPDSEQTIHSDNCFDPPPTPSTSSTVSTPTPGVRPLPPRRMKKRARDDDNHDNINEIITDVGSCIYKLSQNQPLDKHDIFGQNVAHKLRNMSNEQRIFTEKLINEAIFEGELHNLNRQCSILIPSTQSQSTVNLDHDLPNLNSMFNSVPDTESQDHVGSARNFFLTYMP